MRRGLRAAVRAGTVEAAASTARAGFRGSPCRGLPGHAARTRGVWGGLDRCALRLGIRSAGEAKGPFVAPATAGDGASNDGPLRARAGLLPLAAHLPDDA